MNRGQASRRVSSAGGTRCTDMLRALELEDLDKVPRAILREEGPRGQLSRVDIVYVSHDFCSFTPCFLRILIKNGA